MSDDVIKQFLVSLGVKTEGFGKFDDTIKNATEQAQKLGEVMAAAAATVAVAVVKMASDFDNLYFQSKRVGSSASEIKSFSYAIGQMGGSAQGAQSALENVAEFVKSNPGSGGWLGALGLSPKVIGNSKLEIDALSKSLSAMPYYQAKAYANVLGIDPITLQALRSGELKHFEDQYTDMSKRIGSMFGVDLDAATGKSNEFMTNLRQAKAEFGLLFDLATFKVLETILPLLEQLSGGMQDVNKLAAAANIALPAMVGILGAIGTAAAIAAGPYVALAAAIASVTLAYQDWQRVANLSAEQKKGFDKRGADIRQAASDAFNTSEDIPMYERVGRAMGVLAGGFAERASGSPAMYGGKPAAAGGVSAGSPGGVNVTRQQFLERSGLTAEQARGVLAGITAEGGSATSVNPTSGAFGIGQWLGDRKKKLFAKYGPHPSLTQQMQFLVWELKGGDHGGRSVLAQGSAQGTMIAYLRDFMRPQGAHGERIQDLWADINRGNRALGVRGGVNMHQTTTIHVHGAGDARQVSSDVARHQDGVNERLVSNAGRYAF
jgi:hypothetical protein